MSGVGADKASGDKTGSDALPFLTLVISNPQWSA